MIFRINTRIRKWVQYIHSRDHCNSSSNALVSPISISGWCAVSTKRWLALSDAPSIITDPLTWIGDK